MAAASQYGAIMNLKCRFDKERGLPLILTGFVILLDQITKWIIVANWPVGRFPPIAEFGNDFLGHDFLRIVHVRNPAIAFSIGQGLPDPAKRVLFVILPIIVLVILVWYYLSSNEFSKLQRWAIAGILGGGIGNIADRILRHGSGGVVDFICVRFFDQFFGGRWPTFNVADTSVVISCLLLLVTIFIDSRKMSKGITVTEVEAGPPEPQLSGHSAEQSDEQKT